MRSAIPERKASRSVASISRWTLKTGDRPFARSGFDGPTSKTSGLLSAILTSPHYARRICRKIKQEPCAVASDHQSDRMLDEMPEGGEQLGAEGAVDDTVIA